MTAGWSAPLTPDRGTSAPPTSGPSKSTIYVDPSAHRRGVGDALYTELLNRLRGKGFHSAIAVIALPNDPSVRLHERHGFERVGHLREAGYKHDAWHDVGFWQCNLAGGDPTPVVQ